LTRHATRPQPLSKRRTRWAALAVPTVGLLAAATLAATTVPGTGQAASAARPIIFGAAADNPAQVTAHEKVLGRHMEGVRDYKSWDSTLFASNQTWMRDTGHTLFLSIKAKRINGTIVKFADIAAAKAGSTLYNDMVSMATQIKAFRNTVYIVLNHEPEASGSYANGNGAQFAAAWRNFVTIMRAQKVTNAKYVVTFTGYGFTRKDTHNIAYYYPGDTYVDAVAADLYNWGSCRKQPWTPMSSLVAGIKNWGAAHPTKPLMLLEWGTVEDKAVPGRKAQWIKDVQALFKLPAYNQFTALLQWGGLNIKANCPFDYSTSATATAAWAAMGRDPAYELNPA